ncbi:MAG TPA: hypothetical protein ENH06_01065 [bacterium]|nr:hypothetical protein [bacterium]
MNRKFKNFLEEMFWELFIAVMAVFGLIVAMTINIIAGLFIVLGTIPFRMYLCSKFHIQEKKPQKSEG